jgi:outer membrane protein, multidrug efflux system
MNKHLFFLLAGIAIVPVGCTMAPKYSRAKPPIPSDWPKGDAYQEPKVATSAPGARDLKWQEFFADQNLRLLIKTALTNNLDLRLAVLNVEQARAMYGIKRADLMPAFNATADASRQRVPADLSSTGKSHIASQYDVSFGVASWELDFFGRIRSLKDKALQEYFATEQARRSAQILLVSSVANTYLDLAADRECQTLAKNTFTLQQDTYNLIKRRYQIGLADELDVHRAQAQMDAARGDIARFTQLVAQDENALNLLVGGPAPASLLPTDLKTVTPPMEINAGLSSDVLLSRPDILQTEAQLKAAYADIGAARAAFFPRISLTAAVGTASSDLSGLFKTGSGTWSYAPQIALPIFDARTWSALKASRVQREIAVAQYQHAIQSAFKEVADALAIHGTVDQRVSAQQSLVDATATTYHLSYSRYDMGIDGYLSVLDAQQSLYTAQQGFVSIRLAKLASQVNLYAVLGGGWEPAASVIAQKSPATPKSIKN